MRLTLLDAENDGAGLEDRDDLLALYKAEVIGGLRSQRRAHVLSGYVELHERGDRASYDRDDGTGELVPG